MTTYRTIVVGTDGSDTSLRAVAEAAALAAKSDATLIVASAFTSTHRDAGGPDPDQARNVEYRTSGDAPVYGLLREASSHARDAGATRVEERAVKGAPAEALLNLADEVGADLLVIGSVGLNSVVGRLVGSVPQRIKKRAKMEVLIVDTA